MPERDSESGASFWSGAVVRAATTRERIQSAGPASKRTLAEPGLQPGAKFAQSLCPPASSSKNWFESGIFRWTFLVRAEAEIIKPAFGWRSEKRSSVISTTRPWLVPPKCLHVSHRKQARVSHLQYLRFCIPSSLTALRSHTYPRQSTIR